MCSACEDVREENIVQRNAWQPAVIASTEHVKKLHKIDPCAVTQYAGKIMRVRRNKDADEALRAERLLWLGCRGEGLELHPEDAAKYFPDIEEKVSLCTCYLFMD